MDTFVYQRLPYPNQILGRVLMGKTLVGKILPQWAKDRILQGAYTVKYGPAHCAVLHRIRRSNHVKVAFIAGSLSMWKLQALVGRLLSDPRFEVRIILSPLIDFSIESQKSEMEKLREWFDSKGTPYIDFDFGKQPYDLRAEFDPDLIFYMQPYGAEHCIQHRSLSFRDRLQAYVPYSLWPGKEAFGFDLQFHREAFRIYYANQTLLDVASKLSLIHARNARVAGYPSEDMFTSPGPDPWKAQPKPLKRIIWAAHFTIDPEKAWGESHSSFLLYCDKMLELAAGLKDEAQFAFKPHPTLRTKLYELWGKEKTDSYYKRWEEGGNTQLETGGYADLFMNSDAMIHDCGSFIIEYHYSGKPCLYAIPDFESHYNSRNSLGKAALDLHYKAERWEGVESFVRDVVLSGNDPLREAREEFRKRELLSSGSVAERIYRDLTESLGLK